MDHWSTTSSNVVMAWVCGHPNLLTFECLDFSLYFLVYDFLWVFLICVLICYTCYSPFYHFSFQYAFWDWPFFQKFCTCQNHNNNYFYPCISGKLHKYVESCIYKKKKIFIIISLLPRDQWSELFNVGCFPTGPSSIYSFLLPLWYLQTFRLSLYLALFPSQFSGIKNVLLYYYSLIFRLFSYFRNGSYALNIDNHVFSLLFLFLSF